MMESKKLLELIVETLDNGKAHDIAIADFEQTHPLCDYFVICDAPSLRQVNALAEQVLYKTSEAGFDLRNEERSTDSPWILLDFNDVIVHIFLSEARDHYQLDKLYQDYLNERV